MHRRFLFTDIGGSILELHILPVDFRWEHYRYIGWSAVKIPGSLFPKNTSFDEGISGRIAKDRCQRLRSSHAMFG